MNVLKELLLLAVPKLVSVANERLTNGAKCSEASWSTIKKKIEKRKDGERNEEE